jgi:hypothetical protein
MISRRKRSGARRSQGQGHPSSAGYRGTILTAKAGHPSDRPRWIEIPINFGRWSGILIGSDRDPTFAPRSSAISALYGEIP